jgi:hypothetical protein
MGTTQRYILQLLDELAAEVRVYALDEWGDA